MTTEIDDEEEVLVRALIARMATVMSGQELQIILLAMSALLVLCCNAVGAGIETIDFFAEHCKVNFELNKEEGPTIQ